MGGDATDKVCLLVYLPRNMERGNMQTPMQRAIEIAAFGPWPNPNPRVGCVVVASDGEIIAEGWHQGLGSDHAEVMALKIAGSKARGATVYVTLEPCNHYGITPPCVQALVQAEVAKVIYAQTDFHPQAAGGAAALVKQGIAVAKIESSAEIIAAAELNHEWLVATQQQRPYLIAKFAATLDGKIAAIDGSSQWITGDSARADVHWQRAHSDAILVGTGTVLADNPQLNARLNEAQLTQISALKQPLKVIIGNREIPSHYRIHGKNTRFYRHRDLAAVLTELYQKGIRRCYLEGGEILAAALKAGLVNELHAYYGAKILGAGKPAIADLEITNIAQALNFSLVDVQIFADDIRLRLRPSTTETAVVTENQSVASLTELGIKPQSVPIELNQEGK